MTFDSAVSALEGAIESDAQAEANAPSLFAQPEAPAAGGQESAPQGPGTAGATPPPQDPYNRDDLGRFAAAQAAAEGAPAAEDTFAQSFDPNALPPDLQTAYKQMQADYTRKTQEIAETRRQFDALGDHESLQQAAELYQRIQDPRYWPQLTQELSQAMQQYGIQPPGQEAQAPVQPQPQTPQVDLSALAQDPELAPVAQLVKGLQDQVAQVTQTMEAQQEQQRQEQMHMALVGEMQRQHAIIQSQHPEYGDHDLDTIYELAMAHDGNLLEAQQRYEAVKNSVLSSYLEGKQQVATTPAAPIAGGGTVSTTPQKPATLEEATDIAMERLRQAGLDTLSF